MVRGYDNEVHRIGLSAGLVVYVGGTADSIRKRGQWGSLRNGAHDPVGEFAEVPRQLGRSVHFELAAQVQDL
jgi:hypothetical protein